MDSRLSELQSYIQTAKLFKNNQYAYFTILKYAFSTMNKQANLLSDKSLAEYKRIHSEFLSEWKNSMGKSFVLDKENYESFLDQAFSSIDLNTCGESAMSLCWTLLSVLEMYDSKSERFSKMST